MSLKYMNPQALTIHFLVVCVSLNILLARGTYYYTAHALQGRGNWRENQRSKKDLDLSFSILFYLVQSSRYLDTWFTANFVHCQREC